MSEAPSSGRSAVVTAEMLHNSVRDVTLFVFTRPPMIILAVMVAVVLGLATFLLASSAAGDIEFRVEYVGFPAFMVAAVILLVVTGYLSIRRAELAAMPVGATLTVDVREDTLVVTGPQGTSELQLSAYKNGRAMRDTVVLRVAGTSMVQGIPKQLLSAADQSRLTATPIR